MIDPDTFNAPVQREILRHLAAHYPHPVSGRDLCRAVYGDEAKPHRDTLRVLIHRMRARLEGSGWAIEGRDELRQHAYRLRFTAL